MPEHIKLGTIRTKPTDRPWLSIAEIASPNFLNTSCHTSNLANNTQYVAEPP
jgi:hypothetical protein